MSKTQTTLLVRLTKEKREKVEARAEDRGVRYRKYLVALLERAAERGFKAPAKTLIETQPVRLPMSPELKSRIEQLADASVCSPQEWADAVVAQDDKFLG